MPMKVTGMVITAHSIPMPHTRCKIVTSHDAFGYFGKAYGIVIVAPEGISSEAEAPARDVDRIIDQIRTEKLAAVFVGNISDEHLIRQIDHMRNQCENWREDGQCNP